MKMLERHHGEIAAAFGGGSIDNVIAVDIESSVRWVYEDSPQERWDIHDDFPMVVPPWESTWFEARMGNMFEPFDAIGWHIQAIKVDDEYSVSVLAQDVLHSRSNPFYSDHALNYGDPSDVRTDRIADVVASGIECGWMLEMISFFSKCDRLSVMFREHEYLDRRGQIIKGMGVGAVKPIESVWNHISPKSRPAWIEALKAAAIPAYFALSLLHCKNVTTEDAPLPPAKVLKKRQKKGIPQVRFKTLVVEPMRQKTRRERDADPNGEQSTVKRAMHIARGHFKDYTETGLFGKYHGRYWWPMQVRGSAAAGKVVKDYRLETTGIES